MTTTNWDYVTDLADRLGTPDGREEALAIGDRARMASLGFLYQDMLYGVARAADARVIVETGVRYGVSTRFLLEAIKANEAGREVESPGVLYSCDPAYRDKGHALDVISTGAGECPGVPWEFYAGRSIEALRVIAEVAPNWDLFVHDSNHGVECQVFELEFARNFVMPTGFIVVNNWRGPLPTDGLLPHSGVTDWAERHKLEGREIGTAMVFEMPNVQVGNGMTLDEVYKNAIRAAGDATRKHAATKYGSGIPTTYDYYLNR